MSPLHHHFELGGWDEEKIAIRFWIVGILAALLGVDALPGDRWTELRDDRPMTDRGPLDAAISCRSTDVSCATGR